MLLLINGTPTQIPTENTEFVALEFMQLAYGSLEEVDIIGPSPLASARLELARTLLRGETPLATVASLSFVNYGGKFRLEWMSTSERAECFYPSDSFLRLDMLDVQTPVKPAFVNH